jgi:hypothetical protein
MDRVGEVEHTMPVICGPALTAVNTVHIVITGPSPEPFFVALTPSIGRRCPTVRLPAAVSTPIAARLLSRTRSEDRSDELFRYR